MKKKGLFLLETVLLTMFMLTGCGKEKINLNDYVDVGFSGYDTVGIATMQADFIAGDTEAQGYLLMMSVIEDNLGLFGMTIADMSSDWEVSTKTSKEFMENVTGSFDRTTGLSNGDVISFRWSVNEEKLKELEKELNVNFVYSDMEMTVEGLEEAQPWDAFEHMELSYDGRAPEGYVLNEYITSPDVPGLHYGLDKTSQLSNGDIIHVTLSAPGDQDVTEYCKTYGKIPDALSKEFVVEGLTGYVTDIADIPSDLMDSMVSQGEDVFRAYVANAWDKPENLMDVSLAGNYFLAAKPGMYADAYNKIFFVYKVTAINPAPEQTVEFYYTVSWQDIICLSDGTCSVDLSDYRALNSSFKVGTYTYVGYENIESLFNKCVVTQIDFYDYSSAIE